MTKPTAAATIVARPIQSGQPKRWPTRSSIWISANAAARYASDHCTILRCRSLSKTSSTRPPPVRRSVSHPGALDSGGGRHYGPARSQDGNVMTRLADLVQTSDAVAETRARLAKVRALAERLSALERDEISI